MCFRYNTRDVLLRPLVMTQEGSGHKQNIFVSVLWITISEWEGWDESGKYIDIPHMEGNINQKHRGGQSAASYVLRIVLPGRSIFEYLIHLWRTIRMNSFALFLQIRSQIKKVAWYEMHTNYCERRGPKPSVLRRRASCHYHMGLSNNAIFRKLLTFSISSMDKKYFFTI